MMQVTARLELVRKGRDDVLNEECERLSRIREAKINSLSSAKATGSQKGTNRTSMEAQRKAASDEFEEKARRILTPFRTAHMLLTCSTTHHITYIRIAPNLTLRSPPAVSHA